MITLKDYIGKIYKEVTNAKVQSDIETLAIAQEYVANPLLKHFAVPNIRIKDLELTIPIAVDKTETITNHYTDREVQDVYVAAFYKVTDDFFPDKTPQVQQYYIDIRPQVEQQAATQAVQTATDLREVTIAATPSTTDVANADTAAVETQMAQRATVGETSESSVSYTTIVVGEAERYSDAVHAAFVGQFADQNEFRVAMVAEIEKNLPPRLPEIQDLPVIVETQRLKDLNDPSSLISIKVNITDDAMEWTTDVDENGNAVQRLDYL
ncbi:MAG: hypothetical protein AAF617_03920 [Bacteroidota bacterium]